MADFLAMQCECESRELENAYNEMKGKDCTGDCEENRRGLDFCCRNIENLLSFAIWKRKKIN